MAHSRSAVKRIRQNEKRRLRNRSGRSQLRTQLKKVRKLLEQTDTRTARELIPETASLIHRMVKKGIVHRNTGSRQLSRLARRISAGTSS